MQTTSFLESKAFERFEKIFVVASIIGLAGAILPTNNVEGQTSAAQNQFNVAVQLVIYPILLVLVLIHGKRILAAVRSVPWIVALCTFALASAAWSYEPLFTFRRALVLAAFSLFAIYVGANFDWEEQIQLYGWALLYMVVVSYLIIVFLPDYGIAHDLHSGAWKGVFSHKNSLGRVIGFGTVLLIFARPKIGPAIVRIGLLVGTVVLLIFSHSSTAMVAVAACLAAYPCVHLLRLRKSRTIPLWVIFMPIVVLIAAIVALNYGAVASLFGKDTTLSGRTLLWAAVENAIKKRPWFGYGYAVFWARPGADTLLAASQAAMGEIPAHSHDGYLDVMLDLGIVGLSIFAYGLLKVARRVFAAAQDESLYRSMWPLMFLIYFVLFNLTESNILILRAFLWLPFVSIYVGLLQAPAAARSYAAERAMDSDYVPAS